MSVLEVGEGYPFTTISDAIAVANGYDEIRIHQGYYEEVFDCFELTFVGIPGDENDYSTYPVIYTCEESVIKVCRECKFSNIVISANPSINEKCLTFLMKSEKHTEETGNSIIDLDYSFQNFGCILIEENSIFENCIFIGSSFVGIGINLNNKKKMVLFRNCGFFLHTKIAVSIYSENPTSVVSFKNCRFDLNEEDIRINNKENLIVENTEFRNGI